MEYFDFIDSLFVQEKYNTVTDSEKKKFFFMLNRVLSSKFTNEVNSINNIIGINPNHVPYLVDNWQRYLISKFTRKPDFMWIGTSLGKADTNKLSKFDKTLILAYRTQNNIDSKQFQVMLELFPDELSLEISEYKKTTEAFSRKKPTSKK